ncbi:preprotein translocase subunit SecA [Candidatus Legionella polyplacis]|uniref:preprotein translocase subunit SecA n=1 Tax=Candidatus Legionella polyplacis TaxID=2005262 RepID=UPI000C1E86A7|nr:preprotein translocase subunit SecA [Candidatus Legionella polyplacis]ATW01691.1 preprotein translocase subunit SecA [Candidatus Legionella polyplacis]
MLNILIKKIFKSRNERVLNKIKRKIISINSYEEKIKKLSNKQLFNKTKEFKSRLFEGEDLNDILTEAFAVVREVSFRILNLRHFDVQLIGGVVLHEGKVAEMRTGEGKTLVATLPSYLNALTGKGVHVVTVNDYLSKRDSKWMKPIYEALGLTVGVIYADMPYKEKKIAYQSDIIYGTNNEFGFDYLRDNMIFNIEDKVQKELNFAIIDEVDSILIDEARTPLIISGESYVSSDLYVIINKIILQLNENTNFNNLTNYIVDEKQKQVYLTEKGHDNIEKLLLEAKLLNSKEDLYRSTNINLMYHINAALRAHIMFHRNVDYIIKNRKIIIVDEHTGRAIYGRRWSEGLHQAIEAKEHVPIQNENQTLASITFQNYFRLYNKLSGMTGTADTEAYEFQQIYDLEVIVIPTNKPMCRLDQSDLVYLTQKDKYNAIINDVRNCVKKKQPVLIGTTSIESSEILSNLMDKFSIKHQILNAKFHKKEAKIIADAGRPGAVTIATNMAGRGTDIVLGGNIFYEFDHSLLKINKERVKILKKDWKRRHEQVIKSGGLRVIGSERHESRRIDNQLRGRAGRQGDIGSSRFYLSMEDNLMRIFASKRVSHIMKRLGMKSGEPIEHSLISRAIENAQKKLEGYYFDIRKQLLEYDDVINEQRKVFYTQRLHLIKMISFKEFIIEIMKDVISNLIENFNFSKNINDFKQDVKLNKLFFIIMRDFNISIDNTSIFTKKKSSFNFKNYIKKEIFNKFLNIYKEKKKELDENILYFFEKFIILQTLDFYWCEHLSIIDYLRQGIHLRGYAQKDPKQEYKREAFILFFNMISSLKYEIIKLLFSVSIEKKTEIAKEAIKLNKQEYGECLQEKRFIYNKKIKYFDNKNLNIFKVYEKKIGRNDVCPCGSKKKFKFCHGQLS